MTIEIKIPSVGESITEGTLSRWLKEDGDEVRADEPLFELETEKATADISAPAAGTLRITVREGQTVPVGATVGRIEESTSSPREPAAAKAPAPLAKELPRPAPYPQAKEPVLSPAARRLADERGLNVHDMVGTGRGGRITKEDVLTQPKAKAGPPAESQASKSEPAASSKSAPGASATGQPSPRRETRERMSAIRARIAERLVASRNATASLTTFNEADLSAVIALRSRYKDPFRERHGVGLGFMSFFVKAATAALKAFPEVNARIDGNEIVYHDYCDVGVAVSTDKGLMVPILRDADRLTFAQIEARIAELAEKARTGKITVADLQGGTFTITNGGVFGSLLSTPILNPPQCAILGMHSIQKRPVAIGDQVAVRPMMYLALTYDHRLIDGRQAVQFLVRIKESVEAPERLLLEV